MLLTAAICSSEMRAAMWPAESCLKRPRNIGSSGFFLSERVSNGSLNKWAPLLISRWAADVPSPIFYFRTWSFSSLFWRNSREHNVHMWEVFSLRLLSWDLTCFHYMNRLPFWGSIHTNAKGDQYYFWFWWKTYLNIQSVLSWIWLLFSKVLPIVMPRNHG